MGKANRSKQPPAPVAVAAPENAFGKLIRTFADRYELDPASLFGILQATAFKQNDPGVAITHEQMIQLLIVANKYDLNPFAREIFAFADSDGRVKPFVGVDGWASMVNNHPQSDGVEFEYASDFVTKGGITCPEWIECIIYRKDQDHPTKVKEYLDEVYLPSGHWLTHPKRGLRHKSYVQCARLAFSFSGIYDEDEATIVQGTVIEQTRETKPIEQTRTAALKNKLRENAERERDIEQPAQDGTE